MDTEIEKYEDIKQQAVQLLEEKWQKHYSDTGEVPEELTLPQDLYLGAQNWLRARLKTKYLLNNIYYKTKTKVVEEE